MLNWEDYKVANYLNNQYIQINYININFFSLLKPFVKGKRQIKPRQKNKGIHKFISVYSILTFVLHECDRFIKDERTKLFSTTTNKNFLYYMSIIWLSSQ